jgi:hypothetical protein
MPLLLWVNVSTYEFPLEVTVMHAATAAIIGSNLGLLTALQGSPIGMPHASQHDSSSATQTPADSALPIRHY